MIIPELSTSNVFILYNNKSLSTLNIFDSNLNVELCKITFPNHIMQLTRHNTDMQKKSYNILYKYIEAVNWVLDVRQNGHLWDLSKPHTPKLIPNFKAKYDSSAITQIKEDICKNQKLNGIDNISILWGCTDKHQAKAWAHNIYTWTTDTRDIAALLGFTPNTTNHNIINNMIQINSETHLNTSTTTLNLQNNNYPSIGGDIYINPVINIPLSHTNDLYIDIEFIAGKRLIYMIGIGHICDGTYEHTTLIADSLNAKSEADLLNAFYSRYIENKCPRIIAWSNLERSILMQKIKQCDYLSMSDNYIDLCKIIRNGISIRGVFSFGLKDVARALYNAGYIKTKWAPVTYNNLVNREVTTSILRYLVLEYYSTRDEKALNHIVAYNTSDTIALYEILYWLQNHIHSNK